MYLDNFYKVTNFQLKSVFDTPFSIQYTIGEWVYPDNPAFVFATRTDMMDWRCNYCDIPAKARMFQCLVKNPREIRQYINIPSLKTTTIDIVNIFFDMMFKKNSSSHKIVMTTNIRRQINLVLNDISSPKFYVASAVKLIKEI